MTKKTVILSILAIALGFGAMISGCNRDRNRTAMRPIQRRDQVRPAEVLSASAYRPPARQQQPQYYAAAPAYAQPVAPNVKVLPVYSSSPSVPYQPAVVHPTPELAMARASMPVYAPPAAPAPTARQARPAPGRAPIPELEPARYQRPMARANPSPQPAPVMMSSYQQPHDREVQRALAPLGQPTLQSLPPQQGWVASPTTAMRTGGYY